MSTYFVCCFIGNALLPVIGVGVLMTLAGTMVADIAFAGMIAALAVNALIFGLAYRH